MLLSGALYEINEHMQSTICLTAKIIYAGNRSNFVMSQVYEKYFFISK